MNAGLNGCHQECMINGGGGRVCNFRRFLHWQNIKPANTIILKCKKHFIKMLKDVGMVVPKIQETRL